MNQHTIGVVKLHCHSSFIVTPMAISSLGGALVSTGKYLFSFLYPKIKSIIKFRSNLEKLRKEMGNLIDLRDNVKGQIEAARGNGHIPAPAVTKWLQEFEDVKNDVISIETSVESERKCTCPSCCLSCALGGKVRKKLIEVIRLIEAASFPSGMVSENYQVKKVEHIPGPIIEGQTTASRNLMKVLNLLNDDSVNRIGVWGMGGVGKTTLVKNLNNKLETATSTEPFSIIIWATVSKDWDLKRVQTQLLERLNLAVKAGESMESTASRLHRRLEKERFLLILDDVWEAIDLDYLGVPQSEPLMRYKIILTSRSLDVCRQITTDKEVKVDVLDEEESWQLFTQNAGKVASLEHIKPIATEVCKECCGLPLALIIVGASMRGKTAEALWKDALNALQMAVPHTKGIEDKVYRPLKWSYDSLYFQGMDVKSCFLYCSLYPEDFSIGVRELVQCWIAEGLVDKLRNYEDSINRGIALVENLKDSCLLENGLLKDTVKMHDVVRDVSIWIACCSSRNKSFVQAGVGLDQIPDIEFSKSIKRVSFMENRIEGLPNCIIQFPKASSLLLQGNLPLGIVPEGLLLGFPALRVLNLSETGICTLPLSLHNLKQLKALLLQRCQKLKELPLLGSLHKLEVLDCSYTDLEALPEGMENLTKLQLLDLSGTYRLRHIGKGIISQMSNLEILDMTSSKYRWGPGTDVEEGQATLEELQCLNRLSALFVQLVMPLDSFVDCGWKLKRFHFAIGQPYEKLVVQPKYDERRVTLCSVTLSANWGWWLLRNASYLHLENCTELGNLPTALRHENCFSGLRTLAITEYDHQFLTERESAEFDLFPFLEELIIHDMYYLESISDLSHHLGLRFSKLRLASVSDCYRLKCLFSSSGYIPTTMNQEEGTVGSCSFVENASSSEHRGEIEEIVELATSRPALVPCSCIVPNLQIVKLKNLPNLTALSEQPESWQHLEQLEVVNCNRIKKLPFTTQNANTMKEIRGELQWWDQLEWDDEDTKSSLQQYFIPL
ncbi:Disease resistance protein [Actinidia chinensis var. chinensis]|uniref:Disease resistance protein n=1 Tax=Actinidia chinensis var. chinensis TaxID=1590841 RepID=A0A2R6QWW3_ACTCC|nr:Disease resistance protein [Actinidia chinensis var. chinensis]